jgi:hypothetical protein
MCWGQTRERNIELAGTRPGNRVVDCNHRLFTSLEQMGMASIEGAPI